MAPFRFRLASVQKLREAVRDERRAQLAEAYAAEQRLVERRDTVRGELDGLKHFCGSATRPGAVDIDRLMDANRYELILKAELYTIEQHDRTLQEEIERRRQALVAADREVRVLEKLRERKWDQHRQEEALAEIKQLDEVAARQPRVEALG